jgi:hypothetical protein
MEGKRVACEQAQISKRVQREPVRRLGKEGLTQIVVWSHVKKPKSGFSSDWSIRQKILIRLLIGWC